VLDVGFRGRRRGASPVRRSGVHRRALLELVPPELIEAAQIRRHVAVDSWHVDETYVKVGGSWRYLFRAIDQFGQVIDVFLSPRRNPDAVRRFFARAIA
jgi:transposase-like protein